SIEFNLISGNLNTGIRVGNSDVVAIDGNFIGLQNDIVTPLGNGTNGIRVTTDATNLSIGSNLQNVISENVEYGIFFAGDNSANTTFGTNIITCNQLSGIGYGVTPQTPQPVIDDMTISEVTVSTSSPDGSSVTIWLSQDGCNNDQGASPLTFGTVTSGQAIIPGSFTSGQQYTATVTDPNGISEFSNPFTFVDYPDAEGAGAALSFNGTNQDVSFTTPFTLNEQFTIETWIKTTDNEFTIFSLTDGATSELYLNYNISGPNILTYYATFDADGAGPAPLVTEEANLTTTEIIDGEWHHIALVKNELSVSWYIDGVEQTLELNDMNLSSASFVGDAWLA
ncbi:MAG: LamG-like jellyroll fold domain-containing protein, partial [Bacteroidota bacterium]